MVASLTRVSGIAAAVTESFAMKTTTNDFTPAPEPLPPPSACLQSGDANSYFVGNCERLLHSLATAAESKHSPGASAPSQRCGVGGWGEGRGGVSLETAGRLFSANGGVFTSNF